MPDASETTRQIAEVVHDITGAYDVDIDANTRADDIPGWDSLAHMNIIIGIEKRLGIRFTTAELAQLKNGDQTIGDLAVMAAGKIGA